MFNCKTITKGINPLFLSLVLIFTAFFASTSQSSSNASQVESFYDKKNDQVAGISSLMSAVVSKDVNGVRFFSKTLGSSINHKNAGGATALHLASREKNFEMVEILTKRGAKVNVYDNERWTPLMRASLANSPEIVRLLISKGAKASSINSIGESAIIHATTSGCSECLNDIFRESDLVKKMKVKSLKKQLSDSFIIAKNHDNKEIQDLLEENLDKLIKRAAAVKNAKLDSTTKFKFVGSTGEIIKESIVTSPVEETSKVGLLVKSLSKIGLTGKDKEKEKSKSLIVKDIPEITPKKEEVKETTNVVKEISKEEEPEIVKKLVEKPSKRFSFTKGPSSAKDKTKKIIPVQKPVNNNEVKESEPEAVEIIDLSQGSHKHQEEVKKDAVIINTPVVEKLTEKDESLKKIEPVFVSKELKQAKKKKGFKFKTGPSHKKKVSLKPEKNTSTFIDSTDKSKDLEKAQDIAKSPTKPLHKPEIVKPKKKENTNRVFRFSGKSSNKLKESPKDKTLKEEDKEIKESNTSPKIVKTPKRRFKFSGSSAKKVSPKRLEPLKQSVKKTDSKKMPDISEFSKPKEDEISKPKKKRRFNFAKGADGVSSSKIKNNVKKAEEEVEEVVIELDQEEVIVDSDEEEVVIELDDKEEEVSSNEAKSNSKFRFVRN